MSNRHLSILYSLLVLSIIFSFFNQLFLVLSLIITVISLGFYIRITQQLTGTIKETKNIKTLIVENAKAQEKIILENAKKQEKNILENAKIQADNIVYEARDTLEILNKKIIQAKKDESEADRIIKETADLRHQWNEAGIDLRKELYKIRHSKELLNIASKTLKQYYNIWLKEFIPPMLNVQVDSPEYYGHIYLNLEEYLRKTYSEIWGKKINQEIEQKNEIESNIIRLEKELQEIDPIVTLPLHSLEHEDLKKLLSENYKSINKCYKRFIKNYSTTQNKVIYSLITLALKEGFQNIVYSLKYSNYEISKKKINQLIQMFDEIAELGNKTVYISVKKFLSEVGLLFETALDIEYQYYVKKEQIKAEQFELRQKMKEERREAELLKQQQEALLREEAKYQQEIQSIKEKISLSKEQEMIKMLENRIQDLEKQLYDVKTKKEEVLKLQNGKAGYVYIISNMGSFGDNVFKIGVTRRLDPKERIDELSNASVPFKFDVHAYIFDADAVGLENALHKALDNKRVNKVNRRKEFFYCDIQELHQLVKKLYPSASFTETMLAEQYRMSLRLSKIQEELQQPNNS